MNEREFWSLVDRSDPDGCWEWQGYQTRLGYGQVRTGARGGNKSAHRFAFKYATGREIPPGQVVRHSCDNPPCCNPAHLQLGTYLDNLNDARSRGRWKPTAQQSHCRRGHEYTPENTYERTYHGYPHRYCRACKKVRKGPSTQQLC